MRPRLPLLAVAAALACAAAAAGCGFGAGPSSPGTATLTVTRDYGSRTLLQAIDEDPPSSETVIRLLDDRADISTRYGGGFVQSIDGLAGTASSDWFFYVNGIESPVGAADVHVKGGDRIWWDYRDWSAAMSVPAVVGSWPEPFAQESSPERRPVKVECIDVANACSVAKSRLASAGVKARIGRANADGGLRLVVGMWEEVRRDPEVHELRGSPQGNGVFATFKGPMHGDWHLVGLDPGAHPTRDLGPGSGLVAALGGPPTWIVTGSHASAVVRAARLLKASDLRNRYAVAATPKGPVPLPIVGGSGS